MANATQDSLDVEALHPTERRDYLMALVAMARADDRTTPEELALIKGVAQGLGCRLRERDFQTFDLGHLVIAIDRPSLRRAVFNDMQHVARLDDKLGMEEREVLKYFAHHWRLPLPELPGVSWDDVDLIEPEALEKISQRRRRQTRRRATRRRSFPPLDGPPPPPRTKALDAAKPGFAVGAVFHAGFVFLGFNVLLIVLTWLAAMAGEGDIALPLILLGQLGAAFLSALIAARKTTTRTYLAPALGVFLAAPMPLLGLRMFMAQKASDVLTLEELPMILGVSVVGGVIGLVGAWLGERV